MLMPIIFLLKVTVDFPSFYSRKSSLQFDSIQQNAETPMNMHTTFAVFALRENHRKELRFRQIVPENARV